MIENLPTDVEVWPLAADESGVWLISGPEPWRSREPVPATVDPHAEAWALLQHTERVRALLLHSPSWRYEAHRHAPLRGPRVVLSYVAVLPCSRDAGTVRLLWPDARPVDPEAVLGATGPAPSWVGPDSPEPLRVHVLTHAVRHLAFLAATDSTVRELLPDVWLDYLAGATPSLAGQYLQDPNAA